MGHRIALAAALAAILAGGGAAAAQPVPQIAVTQLRSAGTGIGLVDLAGRPHPLTRHVGWYDDDPAFSPDGRRVAFTRSTDGRRSTHVFVMRADGRGVRRITGGRFDERAAWSPDGRWIAYQAAGGTVRLVRPDGRGDHRLPGSAGASSPAFSPDGRRLAFGQGGFVVTVRRDGTARRLLARGREPAFAPDGRTLAFTGTDGGVFTVPLAGGPVRFLHRGMQPEYSPDGTQIAFTRWPASGRFSVWTMRADGSGARRLLVDARSPAWRPIP